jgi:callose synthase
VIFWQIQAAVLALRNTRGMPWPKEHVKKPNEDLLDWLQAMFGFQVMDSKKHIKGLLSFV